MPHYNSLSRYETGPGIDHEPGSFGLAEEYPTTELTLLFLKCMRKYDGSRLQETRLTIPQVNYSWYM